jgi:hypothetical protein
MGARDLLSFLPLPFLFSLESQSDFPPFGLSRKAIAEMKKPESPICSEPNDELSFIFS